MAARNGTFAIKRGRGGKTHFALLASNGRVVATSETYETKESCLKSTAVVKRLAADASVIEDDATPGNEVDEACGNSAKDHEYGPTVRHGDHLVVNIATVR